MATHKNKKLMQEVAVLFGVMALVGGLIVYNSISSQPKKASVAKQTIDTNFDADALNKLQQKDGSYPDVTPTAGDLGKTDPYSK